MFDRIRALGGTNGATRRYPSEEPEDYIPPAEYEDPHTLEDESNPGFGERMRENWTWMIGFSLLGLVVFILAAIYFGRYFITVALNPWTHRVLAGAGIAAAAYRMGSSSQLGRIRNQDELTLYNPETKTSQHYLGRYVSLEGASHDLFVPLKGFQKWGHDPEPYRIGELSRELVQKHGRNPDAHAKIRLHPSVMTVESTERGRKVTQLTAGVEPDPFGNESNLEASLPDMAATDTVSDLKEELEKADEEMHHLKDKTDQLRRQRNDARRAARKNFEAVRKEFRRDAEIFRDFVGPHRRGGSDEDESDSKREQRQQLLQNNGDRD